MDTIVKDRISKEDILLAWKEKGTIHGTAKVLGRNAHQIRCHLYRMAANGEITLPVIDNRMSPVQEHILCLFVKHNSIGILENQYDINRNQIKNTLNRLVILGFLAKQNRKSENGSPLLSYIPTEKGLTLVKNLNQE